MRERVGPFCHQYHFRDDDDIINYAPWVRIGIRRVKDDLLLALTIIWQSSFGPISNKHLAITAIRINFLKDSTVLFKLSTIQSKNEETYNIKEYVLFSQGDWWQQWFELSWEWSQWWFQSENIQLFESNWPFPNSILKLRPRLISHQRASNKGVKILNRCFQS